MDLRYLHAIYFCLMVQTSFVYSSPASCAKPIVTDVNAGTVTFPGVSVPTKAPKIKTKFDGKGLEPFYNLANSFMNTVQRDPPPKFESDFFTKVQTDSALKKKVQDYELPVAITAGLGMLFALLFPIIGCVFCTCRCCNNCGGEMVQKNADAENHTKCCFCSIILFILTCFMLCGVLFMYVTNNRLHAAIDESKSTYVNGIDEAYSFLDTTLTELEVLGTKQLPCTFDLILDDVLDIGVLKQLGEPIKKLIEPHSLPAINSVVDSTKNVSAMSDALTKLSDGTTRLKTLSARLAKEMNDSKNELDSILTDCSSTPAVSECSKVSTSGMEADADFNSLPNVAVELNNIKKILNQNFSGAANKGKQVIQDIPKTVVDKANSTMHSIRRLVDTGTKEVNDTLTNYIKKLRSVLSDTKKIKDYYDEVEKYKKYDKYRWYGFIGLASIMALITLLLAFGLLLGIFSYNKKSFPTNRSSASHCGGTCLMASVWLMFMFSLIFFLITSIFFVVGIHLHIACREIKDGKIIDQYKALSIEGKEIKVEEILKSCRNGNSAFAAIGGNRIINIDEKLNITKQLGNIDEKLEKIKDQVNLGDQSVLNADTRKSLNDLANSSVDNIDFSKFLTEFKKKIVKVDLTQLATNLSSLSSKFRELNNSKATILADRTDAVARNLTNIQATTVKQIKDDVIILEQDVNNLKALSLDLKNVALKILKNLEATDNYLKTKAVDDVFKVVKKYKDRVIGWGQQFASHVISQVKDELGKCKPLSNIYDGLVNVFLCQELFGNLNGFWLSMGWCLFFFPFVVIFAVHLAKYFRRMKFLDGFDSTSRPPPSYDSYKADIPLQGQTSTTQLMAPMENFST